MAMRRLTKAFNKVRPKPARPPPHPGVRQPKEERPRENVFSDDEVEKQFINDIAWGSQAFWGLGPLDWNTIHGIPWKRKMKLGVGSFGAVFVGLRESDEKLFAVKSITVGSEGDFNRRTGKSIDLQLQEIKMMRSLKYKYIVRCLGCGRSKGENGLFQQPSLDVFLEYAIRGSLQHNGKLRSRPFEENPYVRQYTHDLLKALQYMKKKRVVHGDIKMANLLLGEDCVKLADWGGAKQLDRSNRKCMLIGTPGYQPPEVRDRLFQDYSSDVFSLGCTVIEMLTLGPPDTVISLVSGFLEGQRTKTYTLRPDIPTKFSPLCRDFLWHCLCLDSKLRWTADELLHHPFIANRDQTNPLPYQLPIPQHINASLLHHPAAPDPELPNVPMSDRVRTYLTILPKYTDLPAIPEGSSSSAVSLPSSSYNPSPLPPFQPDVVVYPNGPQSDGILNDIVFVGRPSGPQSPASPVRGLASPIRELAPQDVPDSPNRGKLDESLVLVGDSINVDSEFIEECKRIRVRQGQLRGTYPRALGAMKNYVGRLNETFAEMKGMNESVAAALNPHRKRPKVAQKPAMARTMGCGCAAAVDVVDPMEWNGEDDGRVIGAPGPILINYFGRGIPDSEKAKL